MNVQVQRLGHFALHGAVDAMAGARDHATVMPSAMVYAGISAPLKSRYQGWRILSLRGQVEPQLEAFH